MSDDTNDTPIVTDRRTALKKAAVAAGVVAWTTPAVQAVTARPAHAQTVTGCRPVLSATASKTGPTCECAAGADKKCCSDNTVFVDVTATCGALCPGKATVTVITIDGLGPKSPCTDVRFQDLTCPGGTEEVTIKASVKCPDGVTQVVTQTLTVTCQPCLNGTTTTTTTTTTPFTESEQRVTGEETPAGEQLPDEKDVVEQPDLPAEEPPPEEAPEAPGTATTSTQAPATEPTEPAAESESEP